MRVVDDYIRAHPEELRRAFDERRPLGKLEVEVRLDWRCNARCKFCGVWKYSRDGMLEVAEWKRIFSELRERGLAYALFTGGEPLLYPAFMDLLEHVDGLGIESAIITNGFLLSRRVDRLAALAHLQEITVSLDSPDAQVHDEVRKLKDSFRRAIEGMTRVRELCPGVRLSVNTVVTADTAHTMADLLKLPVLPDKIRVFPVGLDRSWLESLATVTENDWAPWAEEAQTQELSPESRARVRDDLLTVARDAAALGIQLESERVDADGSYQGDCYVPLAHLVLQPNGDVYPCCHVQDDANRIGQLAVQSVDAMFEGAPYREMLQRLRPARLPACKTCSRYRAFNEDAQELIQLARMGC